MSDNKYNQTSKVAELKAELKKSYADLSPLLERRDRMQMALNLGIAYETVNRYMDGTLKDIRRLELAESILAEAKTVIAQREIVSAQ